MTAIDDEPSTALPVRRSPLTWRSGLIVVAAGVAALVVAAVLFRAPASGGTCAPGRCSHANGPGTRDVAVTMQNYRVDLPHVLTAGRIRFVVTNIGPTMHELNVARTRTSTTKLPLSAHGLVADHGMRSDFVHVGEVEGIDLAQHKTLTLTLTPGTYVVYCNMDGHYLAGMIERITVVA